MNLIKAKRLFLVTILFATTCLYTKAANIITATVVVTNAANLNGTNAASLTLSADTRIATNTIHSASTQWKASTNTSTAAFNLLQHLRSYPFTGVQTSATNNGVVLTGAEGDALSLTISNNWASVAYRTNTFGSSSGVVSVPYSIFAVQEQNRLSDGLVAWLNIAPTNGLSATAPVAVNLMGLANDQTISGIKTFTSAANVFSGKNLQLAHSAQTPDIGTTNFVADFTGNEYRSITPTANINFIQSTNRAAIRSLVFFLYPNGTNRSLTVPATWHPAAAVDAVLTNTTVGILSITVNGTSETNVFYSYKAVP